MIVDIALGTFLGVGLLVVFSYIFDNYQESKRRK